MYGEKHKMIMNKAILFLSFLAAPLSGLFAQRVVTDNFDLLEIHYQTPSLQVGSMPFADGKADVLQLAGYQTGGEEGSPALPVSIDVLTTPFCDAVEVEVANAVYDTLSLGLQSFYPLQPSRFKSDTGALVPVVNAQRYATDAFWGMPLASVEILGIARDRRLANLTFSPVQVNPVTGQVVICRSADIKVHYIGSDEQATRDHFNRYYTPAFSAGNTLNSLVSAKDVTTATPIRLVIVTPWSLRCHSLTRFANWKRKQGIMTSFYYLINNESNTTIADSLKNLYENATAEAPAPAYVLLIGDNEQFPAFSSRLSSSSMDHVTDLYFVTWTGGDNLPDCYQGRFSATDTSTLASIVSKTLLYEQYAFDNDDYLARAALISGEDNGTHQTSGWSADHAWIYCDPTMDYIAKTYINAANGYDTVSYYKNNVDYAPTGVSVTGYCSDNSAASALRTLYNEGQGWINYSAHGDWNKWHNPSFTVANVNSMTNKGRPSFMIGNCCLTNKFDKPTCFGEALLRKKDNAGAVVYIGGTNSTLWDEDFYWAVGVRSNIYNTMNTDYNSSRLGIYDRLFHTHGEVLEKHAITAGSIVMAGNQAVNSSSSSYKLYYWEIYECMGDPTLIPWNGRASELPNPQVSQVGNGIQVSTLPNVYVAIVDTAESRVLAASFADADGHATFSGTFSGIDCVSITAQGYKHFFKALSEYFLGIDNQASSLDEQLSVYPNPAASHCWVKAEGFQQAELIDLNGRVLSRFGIQGSQVELDLTPFPAGVYLLRLISPAATAVKKLVVNK